MIPESLEQTFQLHLLLRWAMALGGSLGVLGLGWLVARWVGSTLTASLERAGLDKALSRFLGTGIHYVVLFAAIIAAAQTLGVETNSLVALLGTAGLAVGLALQGSLSHLASGVMILFYRPFTIGDVVTIGGKTGRVADVGMYATRLAMPDGTRVFLPNASVTGNVIENHTANGRRRGTIEIGVAYGSDLGEVRAALERAVRSVPEVLPEGEDPGWSIVFLRFGASSLDFVVNVFATPDDWWPMQEKVRIRIYEELGAAGIGIPFPQVDVHFDAALAAHVAQAARRVSALDTET